VVGNVTDVAGTHLNGKIPEIHFTLNRPNSKAGKVIPTEPLTVQPATDGSFTANLESTTDMMDDAWYTVSIQWLDGAGNYVKADFPDWALQVPTGGGSFTDLFGKPPTNTQMIYVSLSAPDDPRKWSFWLEDDPTDPANPLNTGKLHQWRIV
jgi:hypothetical protein